MSNSIKMIVGVVAAVAIPFAAPALAAMVMGSTALPALAAGATALGTTGTSAIIGAGLGAASAAATGGDIGKGALFGGLGGGLGGLAKGLNSGQTLMQAARGVPTAAAPGAAATAGAVPQAAQSVLTPEGYAAYGAQQAAATGGVNSGFNTSSYLAGLNTTGGASGASGQLAGLTGSVPYSPSPAAVGTPAAAPQSFGQRLATGVKDTWNEVTSPENLGKVAVEGGKYVVGSLAAGSGMSAQEEAMMEAQQRELKRAQEANESVFNQRRDEATKMLNEAAYYDPEYIGLQRARDAQLQGSRAKKAGLRGLGSSARQAEGRRYDLGTARATGSAYDEGYQTGIDQRTKTRAAGLAALPAGYDMTTSNYTQLAAQGNLAEERRRQRAKDIGNLFGDFSGTRRAESTGG